MRGPVATSTGPAVRADRVDDAHAVQLGGPASAAGNTWQLGLTTAICVQVSDPKRVEAVNRLGLSPRANIAESELSAP